jgi:hypothetical protein
MTSRAAPDSRLVLGGNDVAALFGLDMADASDASAPVVAKPAGQTRSSKKAPAPAAKRTVPPRSDLTRPSGAAHNGKTPVAKKQAATRRGRGKPG